MPRYRGRYLPPPQSIRLSGRCKVAELSVRSAEGGSRRNRPAASARCRRSETARSSEPVKTPFKLLKHEASSRALDTSSRPLPEIQKERLCGLSSCDRYHRGYALVSRESVGSVTDSLAYERRSINRSVPPDPHAQDSHPAPPSQHPQTMPIRGLCNICPREKHLSVNRRDRSLDAGSVEKSELKPFRKELKDRVS
jgi:hypothetical protein